MRAEPGGSLERDVLDGTFRVFVVAAIVMVVVAAREMSAGRVSAFLAIEALGLALATVGLARRNRHVVRVVALAAGTLLVATMALLHFGPLLGTGFILALVPVIGSLFLGRRGGLAMTALVGAIIAAIGALAESEIIQVAWSPPGPATWVRMTATSMLCASVIVVIVVRARAEARHQLERRLEAVEQARAAEAAQERTNRELARQEHHAALGRLAGGIAHEMNTALGAVVAGLDAARSDADPARREATLDTVSIAAERAARAVQRIALYARGPATDRACRPSDALPRVADALRSVIPPATRLEVDVEPTARVAVPTAVLERALLHLVLDAHEARPGALRLRAKPHGAMVVVEIGAVPDSLSAPRPLEDAVRDAGGTLTREAGALRLELPALAAERPRQGAPAASTPARVLLVEDDEVLRPLLRRALERGGHAVHACASAASAREALGAEPFDLLVTDAVVPGGGIPELIAAFRSRGPVLVCSGQVDEDEVLDGIDRRDLAFLAKPFPPDTLLRAVAELRARAASRGDEPALPVA